MDEKVFEIDADTYALWRGNTEIKPLTLQMVLDFWKAQPWTYPVKEFCGPFNSNFINWLIKTNERCPDCGRKAKEHGK